MRIIWLTGQSGAGKTTLAKALQKVIGGIILDGDEMRESVSADLGFSATDRHQNNLRVAKLARVLAQQQPVIISVIAPFRQSRQAIDQIIDVTWVYVRRDSIQGSADKPYEPPEQPDIIVDSDHQTHKKQVMIIADWLGRHS